ncbi:hypothetical protein ES332_D05G210300v1 [Gossypium tomentosum]|uniref:Uncharacterized protein n=1 Tax=Gossypium tomentosum TaxID=34277 RepID=A0A5D2KY92_GOSTO|nr:hypothetical protein ES332_D05G210300v1 [Gossypium tomentosum]
MIFLSRVKLKGQIMGDVDELVERKKAKTQPTWLMPGALEEAFGGLRALCACFSRQWRVPLPSSSSPHLES